MVVLIAVQKNMVVAKSGGVLESVEVQIQVTMVQVVLDVLFKQHHSTNLVDADDMLLILLNIGHIDDVWTQDNDEVYVI